MKTSYAGLGINEREWETNMRHIVAALNKFKIPPKERREFWELFERYKSDIIEQP